MRTKSLPLLIVAGMLCFGNACANDEISKKVQGDWLASYSGNLLTAVLQVKGHKEDGPARFEYYGYFGANGARFPTPLDVVFTPGNSGLALSASVGSLKIEAKQQAEDLFVGSITIRRGTFPVRFEKLSQDSIKARPFNIPAVSKNARLEMIYLSSYDCIWCARWESGSKQELLASPEGKVVRFVEVKNATLSTPIVEQDYPVDYRWVYEQIGPTRGVPRFIFAIDGMVVLNAFGNEYDRMFLPALKRVVEKRNSAR